MPFPNSLNPVLDGMGFNPYYIQAAQTVTSVNAIPPNRKSIVVSANVNSDVDDFIVLPALADVPVGHEITIQCSSGLAFEVRTPAGSNEKINDQDSDGTKEYLCSDTEVVKFIKRGKTAGWVAFALTALGAQATAVVPDAISYSPSASTSPSSSASASVSPSASRSPSASASVSLSPSSSASASRSPSASVSPSSSASSSSSASQSPSASLSPSSSASSSASPSVSPSSSASSSSSASLSPSASESRSASPSSSRSPSASTSVSASVSPSSSTSPSSSASPSP